jgi:hypothetical protein
MPFDSARGTLILGEKDEDAKRRPIVTGWWLATCQV